MAARSSQQILAALSNPPESSDGFSCLRHAHNVEAERKAGALLREMEKQRVVVR